MEASDEGPAAEKLDRMFEQNVESDSLIDWESKLGQTPISSEEPKEFGVTPEFLEKMHKLYTEHGREAIRKYKGINYLAGGGYRAVYAPFDNVDYVIKFSKHPPGSKMNEFEFNSQVSMGGLFPKVYMHGKGGDGSDFDWMVVERVRVIRTYYEAIACFPKIHKLYQEFQDKIKGKGFEVPEHMSYYGRLIPKSYNKDWKHMTPGAMYDTIIYNNINHIAGIGTHSSQSDITEINLIPEVLGRSWKEIELIFDTDPVAEKLRRKIKELNLETGDLNPGNIGVDKAGNFVIIDIMPKFNRGS